MNRIGWDEAHERARHLGLPPVVLAAFRGERVPDVLKWAMRDAYEIFDEATIPHHDDYPPGSVVPLWADHTGYTITAHRTGGERPGFLRFSLEGPPGDPPDDEGLSWAQILVQPLLCIWEDNDGSDEEADAAVREAAQYLGFEPVETLLNAFREPERRSADTHEDWYRKLLSRLSDYVMSVR
ncbi:MAG: hypothetical protein HOW73_26885 [Polyangiaceae bacterium]|nr:hypothetical protein [Polyangiaceae bacterium]